MLDAFCDPKLFHYLSFNTNNKTTALNTKFVFVCTYMHLYTLIILVNLTVIIFTGNATIFVTVIHIIKT